MRRVVFVAALVMLVPFRAQAQLEEWIWGCWEWSSTVHADGSMDTPETLGYAVEFEFLPDHRFFEYRNEQVALEAGWEFRLYYECTGVIMYVVNMAKIGDGQWFYWTTDSTRLRISGTPFHRNPTAISTYTVRAALPNDRISWGRLQAQFR
jgi:hypothetical protein